MVFSHDENLSLYSSHDSLLKGTQHSERKHKLGWGIKCNNFELREECGKQKESAQTTPDCPKNLNKFLEFLVSGKSLSAFGKGGPIEVL